MSHRDRRYARLLRKRPCCTRFLPVVPRPWARNELTRRDEGAYRQYSTEEQRRQPGCSAGRMQPNSVSSRPGHGKTAHPSTCRPARPALRRSTPDTPGPRPDGRPVSHQRWESRPCGSARVSDAPVGQWRAPARPPRTRPVLLESVSWLRRHPDGAVRTRCLEHQIPCKSLAAPLAPGPVLITYFSGV